MGNTEQESEKIQNETHKAKESHEVKKTDVSQIQSAQEKLEKAYGVMLQRVKEQLDDVSKKAEPMVDDVMEKAKHKAVALGELTEEEAEKIGEYLMRDLRDAGEFLKDAKRVLADWIYFDYKLIETKFWETYKVVSKQVSAEWTEFSQRLKHAKEYKTGEVIGIGTLTCQSCHEVLHFTKSSTIPKCPKCAGTQFARKSV